MDKGSEVDWMRVFWDVLTDQSTWYWPQVLDWVNDAGILWDPYSALDSEANAVGGGINTAWDTGKALNGVDW